MDTLRILTVDDEPGVRHGIKRSLAGHRLVLADVEAEVDFEVTEAESGEEALRRLEEDEPDIMLLDHKMDGMSGLEVLEAIQRRPRDLLVIMVTAFATIETAVRATKSGAFDFIAKPFTPVELKETIRKASTHLLTHRQARKLAEEKKRVRFEFIRVLGHELKAPLGAIENYLHLMRDRAAGPEIGAYEQMIGRCLARTGGMRKLIVDLLDMTRLESGEKRRELGEVDLVEAARLVIDGLLPQAGERSITIELEAPGALALTADRSEIEIVLNNLVSNAVKYNRDGGRVDVRLIDEGEQIRIEVSDTGIGIAPEDAARLFNDFVRVKTAATRDILGSGLGLSIVKKIAALYDGEAQVESEPNVGSTFRVVLKGSQAAEPAAEAPSVAEAAHAVP